MPQTKEKGYNTLATDVMEYHFITLLTYLPISTWLLSANNIPILLPQHSLSKAFLCTHYSLAIIPKDHDFNSESDAAKRLEALVHLFWGGEGDIVSGVGIHWHPTPLYVTYLAMLIYFSICCHHQKMYSWWVREIPKTQRTPSPLPSP